MNFSDLVSVFSWRGLFSVIIAIIVVLGINYVLVKFNIISLYLMCFVYIISAVVLYFIVRQLKFNIVENMIFLLVFILLSLDVVFIDKPRTIETKLKLEAKEKKSIFKTEERANKYRYASIEDKIIILKNMGLSKEKVFDKLKNNMEFRELIKNDKEAFHMIYTQKQEKM